MRYEKRIQKLKSVSVPSLARREVPQLFDRARGRLHWEKDLPEGLASQLCQVGDSAALREYLNTHRERLSTNMDEMHAEARRLEKATHSQILYTNLQWMEWLDTNEE